MKAQLTIRDLFWLIALVAVGCVWWVDRRELGNARRELENAHTQMREALAVLRLSGWHVPDDPNFSTGVLMIHASRHPPATQP